MRICDLKLYIVELPFRFSFNHSLAQRSSSLNLIVKAVIESSNDDIVQGYGEGIPRKYVTGETIEQASSLLTEKYFPRLLDKHFSNAFELVEFLQEQFRDFGLEERSGGASWCALELALLDAACKADKISLQQLIGSDNDSNSDNSIRYGAVASLTNKTGSLALLTFFRLYGFSTVKLKIGKDLESDLKRVAMARKIMGDKAIIRVDANCAWSVAQTLEFAQKVEAYNVASIEQPVEPHDVAGLIQLASTIPQAIVLDESLCTVNQALDFVNKHSKAHFNIRISKMGGIIAADKIRNIAKQAGIPCHLGAQVGESGILTAAGRIFAISKGPFVNHEGAANTFLLKKDLTKENLTFGYGGIAKMPSSRNNVRIGLGITIDEQKLLTLVKEIPINTSSQSLSVDSQVQQILAKEKSTMGAGNKNYD